MELGPNGGSMFPSSKKKEGLPGEKGRSEKKKTLQDMQGNGEGGGVSPHASIKALRFWKKKYRSANKLSLGRRKKRRKNKH